MKLRAILSILFAVPITLSAQPQPAGIVTLLPGQAVTIHIAGDAGGAVTLEGRGAADLSDFDRAAIRRFSDPKYNAMASGPTGVPVDGGAQGLPAAAPVAPGAVHIMFAEVADGAQTMLILENGYDRGLVYRARIREAGTMHATDVCLVMPMRRGYENWPFASGRIELSDFRLEPWDPSQGIQCR